MPATWRGATGGSSHQALPAWPSPVPCCRSSWLGGTLGGPRLLPLTRLGFGHSSPQQPQPRAGCVAVRAQRDTYEGVYGPWSVEDSDKAEVLLYRAGLNLAAFSLLLASIPAVLDPASPPPLPLDALFWAGASGLGLSLALIHIYVTPIKRALQALWAIGFLGALVLSANLHSLPGYADVADASSAASSLVLYVVRNPVAVWAVGPLFAALTGLVFKEGLCYGKLEAALLVLVIPSLLLGHLAGVIPPDAERVVLATWVALFLVFALRKFTQPIKDDIGDKSVFIFQALPPEEQERILIQKKSLESRPPQ